MSKLMYNDYNETIYLPYCFLLAFVLNLFIKKDDASIMTRMIKIQILLRADLKKE